MQHLVAYSSLVDGAAIAAGSPYGCGSLQFSNYDCLHGLEDGEVNQTIAYLWKRVQRGEIDDPEHLKRTPVTLFVGKGDENVYRKVMVQTRQQLLSFVDSSNLHSNFHTDAAHVWSVDHGRCRCGVCPYGSYARITCCSINNCAFDLSGAFLRATYGAIQPRVPDNRRLHWINQTVYWPASRALRDTVMQWAIAYVPEACEARPSRCKLHVNYHGCIPPEWRGRLQWVRHLDLNEYAEANAIVVLYPQAQGSPQSGVGCWNWESYKDDPDFDTRRGCQLSMVMAMAADLDRAIAHALVSKGKSIPSIVRQTHRDTNYASYTYETTSYTYGSYSYT